MNPRAVSERLLIVEDEPAVARSLRLALEREGFAVSWAKDGGSALRMARSESPQAILLDIRLPDISGYDVCRQLRREGMRQPILMLTARDDELDKVLGLELGADDYVVKPYSLRELISRIRALLRRAYGELASAEPGGLLHVGGLEIDQERMLVRKAGRPVELTPTEYRLLLQLARNAERPQAREQLIEAVWGYDAELGNPRTIDVHIRHLREKLEDDPQAPVCLQTVRGVGYVLRGTAQVDVAVSEPGR